MDADSLLRTWGFTENPFKMYTAEAEKERDPHLFFLEPPYFKDILGNPANPSSSIVFGHRGEGKSTICNMINHELRNNEEYKVLVVTYMDFPASSVEGNIEVALDHHLERILSLSVQKFVEQAEQDARILENCDPNSLSLLQWFVLRFLPAPEYSQVERKLVALFDTLPQAMRIKRIGGRGFRRIGSYLRRKKVEFERIGDNDSKTSRLLKAVLTLLAPSVPSDRNLRNETRLGLLAVFRDLIIGAGFVSIYVLVDKLDQIEAWSGDYEIAANLISPIVTSLGFLETEKVATKLFLPTQVSDILGGHIRTDRILTRSISWSKDTLSAMLGRRLLAFSRNQVETLKPFVEADTWDVFEQKLFFHSALCPRNLLRIIDHIIAELCQLEQHPSQITTSAIDMGIHHFLTIRLGEEDAAEYQRRLDSQVIGDET